MKIRFAAVAIVAMLALTGCTDEASSTATDDQSVAASQQRTVKETPAVTASPEPLVAETAEPAENEADEIAFLEFVHGRLATFPSQIADATDEQLFAAAADACERIRGGESVEKMSVIEGEKPSEVGGYFYDSNAIIAGAQMHLCSDTLG